MLLKSDESEFKCQTCILVKSHRVSFSANSNKSCVPFSLVHYDVWGPTLCSYNFDFRWFVTFIDDCTRMT